MNKIQKNPPLSCYSMLFQTELIWHAENPFILHSNSIKTKKICIFTSLSNLQKMMDFNAILKTEIFNYNKKFFDSLWLEIKGK